MYEVVSSDKESQQASSSPKFTENDEFVELKLDSPFVRGDRVRTLQTALEAIGFEVGTIDGVFGRGTDQAVRAFQEWYGLPVTGVVDIDTANGIAAEYAAIFAPPQAPSGEPSDSSDEPQQQAEPSATDNEEQGENASGATQSTGDSNPTESNATDTKPAESEDKSSGSPAGGSASD